MSFWTRTQWCDWWIERESKGGGGGVENEQIWHWVNRIIPSAAVLVMANMLMAIIWSKLDLLIAEDVGYSNRVSNSPMSWYCNVGNRSILPLSNRQILIFYSSRISSQIQIQNFSQEWQLLFEGRHLIKRGVGGRGVGHLFKVFAKEGET